MFRFLNSIALSNNITFKIKNESSMIQILFQLFLRDLEKLKTEISSFKDEKKIWEISGDVKNSAGNLCLHLCGNL